MNQITLLSAISLLSCSALVTQTVAQPVSEEPTVRLPGPAARQHVPEDPTLLHATQLIQYADNQALAIAALSEVPHVEVVNVDDLVAEEASEHMLEMSLEEFVVRYYGRIAMLRDAMAANAEVRAALEGAEIDISKVIAAEIRPDLALRAYVWNQ